MTTLGRRLKRLLLVATPFCIVTTAFAIAPEDLKKGTLFEGTLRKAGMNSVEVDFVREKNVILKDQYFLVIDADWTLATALNTGAAAVDNTTNTATNTANNAANDTLVVAREGADGAESALARALRAAVRVGNDNADDAPGVAVDAVGTAGTGRLARALRSAVLTVDAAVNESGDITAEPTARLARSLRRLANEVNDAIAGVDLAVDGARQNLRDVLRQAAQVADDATTSAGGLDDQAAGLLARALGEASGAADCLLVQADATVGNGQALAFPALRAILHELQTSPKCGV